mmetsp:Transcript_1055/g.2906  ORF Transcript_1055/g.2906 Transcript_1055/m.2906 type:complete len:229 (-) Transcript_1055:84-770(-)
MLLAVRNTIARRAAAPMAARAASSMEDRLRPLLRLVGYYGADSTRARTAEGLFRACATQASLRAWAKPGLVETREFRPRHALVFAHVWLLHRGLEAAPGGLSPGDARLLQEALFDELWEDTILRIRAEGVAEISNNKHLTDVQKYSFQAALEYDDAVARPDADDARDALGAAVWRHVYLAREGLEAEHCHDVADYLTAQLAVAESLDAAALEDGAVPWTAPTWRPRGA